MPDAAFINESIRVIIEKAQAASPLLRVMLVSLVVLFAVRRRVTTAFVATFVGLVFVASAVMSISFEDYEIPMFFAVFFVLGLAWGREALVIPPDYKSGVARVAVTLVLCLGALFYPGYMEGVKETLLLAPLGTCPSANLIVACAAIVISGRSLSIFTAAATWVTAALFAVGGLVFLGQTADIILAAAVPVSVIAYFVARPESKTTGKRGRPRRPGR
jgi:hypothetical protein